MEEVLTYLLENLPTFLLGLLYVFTKPKTAEQQQHAKQKKAEKQERKINKDIAKLQKLSKEHENLVKELENAGS